MTACNAQPPAGHPFHGTLVACHLRAGHRAPHSWEIQPAQPWRAVFEGGPAQGSADRIFAVGEPWREMRVVWSGRQTAGWMLVGGDGIDSPDDPGPAWEGEVTYRLVRVELGDVVGEPGAVAYYSPAP